MTILSDLFIGLVTFILDVVTRIVFEVISILLLTVLHSLKLPGLLLARLLKTAIWGVPSLAEHILTRVVRLFLSFALVLLELFLYVVKSLVSFLLFAIFDFFQLLYSALYGFTELMTVFLFNLVKLSGVSFFIVWKNFSRAVIFFIRHI